MEITKDDGSNDGAEESVRALARGLALMEAFEGSRSLTLTATAQRTNLSRGTARRLLLTLVKLGYVGSDGHQFWLRPRLLALGHAYLSGLSLPDLLLPYMEQMIGTDERVASSAGVLDDIDIVLIAGVPSKALIRVALTAGMRLPASCSALGRVLLSDLPDAELNARLRRAVSKQGGNFSEVRAKVLEARAQGYGVADQEIEVHMRSLAVAVRDRQGKCVAAMTLTSLDETQTMDQLVMALLPRLLGPLADRSSALYSTNSMVVS